MKKGLRERATIDGDVGHFETVDSMVLIVQ
jgi:hypothetical protein